MQSNELRMHMFCLEYCAAIISHLWRHDFTLWQHSFVVAPCRAASMESRFYQACREPALQSSRQAAKQSDRTLRAERPRPQQESAHESDGPATKKQRRSFLASKTTDLGKRAHEYKLSRNGPHGEVCGTWLREFCDEEWPDCKDLKVMAANKKHTQRAHATYEKNVKVGGSVFARDVNRSLRMSAPARALNKEKIQSSRRFGQPGSRYWTPCVREELYCWFIDSIQNVKGRITGSVMLAQARVLLDDFDRNWNIRVKAGQVEEANKPRLPILNSSWLYRFRQEYKLSWRMVNLTFKVSQAKLFRRLDAFYCNIFKIRWLHYHLNGRKQILRFSNSDQKPFWFTSTADVKTLSIKGLEAVGVKFNVPMTRMRFTVITRCTFPGAPKDGKHIAVLLRGKGVTH